MTEWVPASDALGPPDENGLVVSLSMSMAARALVVALLLGNLAVAGATAVGVGWSVAVYVTLGAVWLGVLVLDGRAELRVDRWGIVIRRRLSRTTVPWAGLDELALHLDDGDRGPAIVATDDRGATTIDRCAAVLRGRPGDAEAVRAAVRAMAPPHALGAGVPPGPAPDGRAPAASSDAWPGRAP